MEIQCPGCGKPFEPMRSNQRYHNDACKQKAYRQRHVEEWRAIKIASLDYDTRDEHVIYALVDPRDMAIRYIGMSKDVLTRFKRHLACNDANAEKIQWLQELEEEGLTPYCMILSLVKGEKLAKIRESDWIKFYRHQGASLTNIVENGDDRRQVGHEL